MLILGLNGLTLSPPESNIESRHVTITTFEFVDDIPQFSRSNKSLSVIFFIGTVFFFSMSPNKSWDFSLILILLPQVPFH